MPPHATMMQPGLAAHHGHHGHHGQARPHPEDKHDLEKNPLLKNRLQKPRTLFFPQHRIMMNFVPMVLNILGPWALFTACHAMTTFSPMYTHTSTVYSILVLLGLACVGSIVLARYARYHDPEPTWFSYVAIVMTIAFVLGTWVGLGTYETYSKRYYEIQDLKVVQHLDPDQELGQNLLDAGIAYFSDGSRIDGLKAWHFKQETMYCVAPITKNGAEPSSGIYDFWAVGTDCCAMGASDFRCGDWETKGARSAVRALDPEALKYFGLAVKQAESLYNYKAAHPVFFYWSKDPIDEVQAWRDQAFRHFLFNICLFLVCALLAMCLMICRYSMLGRSRSSYAYAANLADDAVNVHGLHTGEFHASRTAQHHHGYGGAPGM